MRGWRFDWFTRLVVLCFFLFFGFYLRSVSWCSCYVSGYFLVSGEYFCFDVVAFYLILLSFLVCMCLFFFKSWLGPTNVRFFFLVVSLMSSVLCYCCVNAF